MAQDTHLFSVSKPRQTLGNIHHNSALPQPSSALKRSSSISGFNKGHHLDAPATVQHSRSQSSSRMSMMPSRPPQPNFTRSSSGTNLNDLGKSVQRSRMSYAPGGNPMMTPHHGQSTVALGAQSAIQRRSSVWSGTRPSNGPQMGHQQSFFVQAPLPPGVPTDSRRLRDRNVQTHMIAELERYVTENNFTLDMKHQLQPNAFRQPTQKDFNMIFQWLYKRIDPAYTFQKSIDNEVPALLNQLRYPFAKAITKSQLSAVGGQNWHVLLGMLHWLMQLANMMDGFASAQFDYALEDEGIDVSGDRIISGFLSRAYHTWVNCPDDMAEEDVDALMQQEVKAMAREFEDNRAAYTADLEMLEAENAKLLKQIEAEEAAMPDMQELDNQRDLLESDAQKFETYAKKMAERLVKTEDKIRLLKDEMVKCEGQIEEALQDKADLQEAVDRQGITIQQIDQMNSERERLQGDGENIRQRLEDVTSKIKQQEQEASAKLAHLESLARDYNSLCYDVGIREEEFELAVQVHDGGSFSASQLGSSRSGGDRLLADSETGYHPARILNLDMRGRVKSHITGMRRDVDKRRTTAKEKDEEIRKLLFDTASAIDDKQHEVEALQHRVAGAEEEYEKTKDATSTQKLKSDAEIERTEKELARMRGSLTDDIQYWQQREMNAEIECEQLALRAASLREELHTESERMLDYIVKFKLHIQDGIEGYETFVNDEVDREVEFDKGLDGKMAAVAAKLSIDDEDEEPQKVEDDDEEDEEL